MGHSATHVELHRLFVERQIDEIEKHLAPGFMFEDLAQHVTLKTTGEYLDYLRGWVTMCSDVGPGEPRYYEGPDHSVALFHARGHNDGPVGDLPATGRAIDLPVCEVLHYAADGKVLGEELYWDQATMMGQLQPNPEPSSAEAAGSPTEAVREFMEAFDRGDYEHLMESMADDVQGIDEISRSWMRGRDAVRGYFENISGLVADVSTTMSDVTERVFGDTAVVTGWIEQDYTMQGKPQHISSPLTAVLRKDAGRWRAVHMHAVPMPEE